MSKTLLILRHAKSSWKDDALADHDRPLSGRGLRDAPRMGRLLRKVNLEPELILSSTAKRARKTVAAVADESGYGGDIRYMPDLYHADPLTFIEILRDVPDAVACVMVVGHNPGLELLLETLTGDWERLPTGALAQVSLPIAHWNQLDETTAGELVNLWTPRAVA
ncbi:MAG: histidine phosphatase family protein [Anaerolineae bacterium]|nr:histidine phosphatase family protein [Anaerolineae bacterium]